MSDDVRYRRFHVLEDEHTIRGGVTAAVRYMGYEGNSGKFLYHTQFAYTSPKEKHENKKLGQLIARLRLFSRNTERGHLEILLDERNKGLTSAIKDAIIMEAKRKKISWLMNKEQAQLV